MSLIKKPEIADFRDSRGVRAVRGTTAVVSEGAGAAARTAGKLWLGLALVAFITSGLGALFNADGVGGALMVMALIAGAVYLLVRLFKGPSRAAETAIGAGSDQPPPDVSVPLPAHLRAPGAEDGFHADYWPRALAQKAAMLAVVGLILVSGFSGIVLIVGTLLLMRALLLLLPLFGRRACVRGDADTLTVHSLIGAQTLAWSEVDKVALRRLRRRDLWSAFTVGTRRTVAVAGRRGGHSVELHIPYPLLGLDEAGAERLAATIVTERNRALPQRRGRPPAAAPGPWGHHAPPPPAAPEPFDAGLLRARHRADRDAAVEAAGLPPLPRTASFGRKKPG